MINEAQNQIRGHDFSNDERSKKGKGEQEYERQEHESKLNQCDKKIRFQQETPSRQMSNMELAEGKNSLNNEHFFLTSRDGKGKRNKKKQQSRKRKDVKGTKFFQLVKSYRIKNIVNLFVAKLMRNSPFRNPVDFNPFEKSQKENGPFGFQFGKRILKGYNVFCALNSLVLFLVLSLNLAFATLDNSEFVRGFKVYSLGLMGLQILAGFFNVRIKKGKKLLTVRELAQDYVKKQIFFDLICLLSLVSVLFSSQIWAKILSLTVAIKIPGYLSGIKSLEAEIVQNFYSEQYCAVVKVFLQNLAFSHVMAIILIMMAWMDAGHNWMIVKGISNSPWLEQYSWAYYWSTNIMLTVGFGDISAANYSQALCLTMIETVSCLFFAYNINCIGNLINKLRENQIQKEKDTKVWKRLSKNNQIQQHIDSKFEQYIDQSFKIQTKVKFQEEEAFTNKLPESLKDQFLTAANRKILSRISCFKSFTSSTINNLAKSLTLKIYHPNQNIIKKDDFQKIKILRKGEIGYYPSFQCDKHNKKCIQNIVANKNGEKLLYQTYYSFHLSRNYDIKSIGYSILVQISLQEFKSILKHKNIDFQYFFLMRDKEESFSTQKFQNIDCQHCKQKHCKFRCPRLHFVPFPQQVIFKYLSKENKKINYRSKINRVKTDVKVFQKTLFPFFKTETYSIGSSSLASDQKISPLSLQMLLGKNKVRIHTPSFSEFALQARGIELRKESADTKKFKNFSENFKKQVKEILNIKQMEACTSDFWSIECDEAKNYRYYFPTKNPDSFNVNEHQLSMVRNFKKTFRAIKRVDIISSLKNIKIS